MTKIVGVGPILHGKSGPGRTTFVWLGPFLANKIGCTWTSLADKSGSEKMVRWTKFAWDRLCHDSSIVVLLTFVPAA